jgi:hypothetical protein
LTLLSLVFSKFLFVLIVSLRICGVPFFGSSESEIRRRNKMWRDERLCGDMQENGNIYEGLIK